MKSLSISALLFLTTFSALAFESGKYMSTDYNDDLSPFYKSVTLDSSKCKNGGAIVTFNQASPFNLCHGNVEESVYEYKECVGKEVGSFPLPKVCVGVKKTIRSVTTKSAVLNKAENALIYSIETHNNDVMLYIHFYFED